MSIDGFMTPQPMWLWITSYNTVGAYEVCKSTGRGRGPDAALRRLKKRMGSVTGHPGEYVYRARVIIGGPITGQ